MKRVLLFGVIGTALLSIMCMGVVILALLFTPARVQARQAVARLLNQAEMTFSARPEIRTSPSSRLPNLEQETSPGVLIAEVAPGSPAEEAGLRRGDILLAVNSQRFNSVSELRQVIRGLQSGEQVNLTVQRGDVQVELAAVLSETLSNDRGSGILGITTCGSNERSAKESYTFELQPGFRVLEVVEGGPADQAGLRVGDIIQAVDGTPLQQPDDLADRLAERQPGNTIVLEVLSTDGESRTLDVTLGEHPEREGAAYLGIRYGSAPLRMSPGEDGMPWMPEINPERGLPEILPHPGIPFPHGNLHPGALIQEVLEGGPADLAGLPAGALLQAVDNQELVEPQDLSSIIADHQPGDVVTLTYFDPQTGESKAIEVTLGENPDNPGSAWLGVRYAFLNIQIDPPSQPNENPLPEG
jgi:S1-C subfamily serine protease